MYVLTMHVKAAGPNYERNPSFLLSLWSFRQDSHSFANYSEHDLICPASYGGKPQVSVKVKES